MQNIEHAATLLREGKLVAFPTETVYGLGADATNERAVAEIYAAKGRPQFNPLIIHFADIASAKQRVVWNAHAEKLARAFWPGPLTIVLPRAKTCDISLLAGAGLETLAVRVPAHPLAQALLNATHVPLAAPSANRSGRVSPTLAAHVHEELHDKVAMILDGGPCEVGLESTVVDATGARVKVLRPGSVTPDMLCEALLENVELAYGEAAGEADAPASPGMLLQHYAPGLPVRLHAQEVRAGEALIAFGAAVPAGAERVINLSERGDLTEAAANLFASMRALDLPAYSGIAVMPIPEEGLGAAINDRLKRAAAK